MLHLCSIFKIHGQQSHDADANGQHEVFASSLRDEDFFDLIKSACLRIVLLRQDQQEEYKSEQTHCFRDAHGDDHEHQALAFTF